MLYLGINFFLGFADITQTQMGSFGSEGELSIRLPVSIRGSILGSADYVIFIRIRKAESDLTADEKLARQESTE